MLDPSWGTARPGPAIYLRRYPFDRSRLELPRRTLELLARDLGLPRPFLYLDHGLQHERPLPGLRRLLGDVGAGEIDTVLIPGRFVFSLDARTAAHVLRRIRAYGCRLVEPPH